MVIAIVLGIAVGLAGFAVLIWGMKLARKATPTSSVGYAGGLLLGVLGSFTILAAAVIICIVAARSNTLPFVIAEAGSLIVAAIAYGVARQLR